MRPRARAVLGRRGGLLAMMAVALVGLMGMLVIAADVGMVYTARSEAQRSADAAALAGMSALLENPDDLERVRRVSAQFATANRIRGQHAFLLDEDVSLYMGRDTLLHVVVMRNHERGNAIPTVFGRLVGMDHVSIAAEATAGFARAGGATCLKPFLIPDLWDDANGNGRWDAGEHYHPLETGYGSALRTDRSHDVGRQVVLYPGSSGSPTPSFYYLWRMPDNSGANDVRNTVANAACDSQVILAGGGQDVEPGAKKGPVNQGISDLIGQDPGAYWDESTGTIAGSTYGDAWGASPRVAKIAVFDPREQVSPGFRPVTVTNFVTIFIEGRSGDQITGRILPATGIPTLACAQGQTCTGARFAQLVR
jgi:hypothetical protein